MQYLHINTFGTTTTYKVRYPLDVHIGARRNRFESRSDFKDYSTSNLEEIKRYTPVQIMKRSRNREYPTKYDGITPSFGLDVTSINQVEDYLKQIPNLCSLYEY